MTLDEALSCVGQGWSNLIRRFFLNVDLINDKCTVTEVSIRSGMLRLHATAEDPIAQDMLDRLAWSYERTSASMCEVCGEYGFRRKTLQETPNLCFTHYVELLNNLSEKDR